MRITSKTLLRLVLLPLVFLLAALVGVSLISGPLKADEGMFPISELAKIGLAKRGIELQPDEIFSVDGTSLVDGICRVNGCTGSFVSADGLIITNHHCAFDAIQKGSSAQRDLLADGFIATKRGEEIRAPNYTVRITETYTDVSSQVLAVAKPEMSFLERTKALDRRRKELELAAERENPGMRAEVAEMFVGKTYVLFLYTYLKDVRLVFAPPIAIGAFGGEVDNWEWPRHTGDFSLMRAYTAPDGQSAEYAPENIPYRPKRFLKVQAAGIDEGDTVFLLGYPGRTVRNRTASFVRYEQTVRLPTIVELYSWQIQEMERAAAQDRSVAIKHSARTKSLANVEKRSRGQLIGLKKANTEAQRSSREKELQAYIDNHPTEMGKYQTTLSDIAMVYDEMTRRGPLELHVRELRTAPRFLSFAFALVDAATERTKPDVEREAPYMDRNFSQTTQQLLLDVGDWHGPTDQRMLAGMLERLKKIPEHQEIEPLARVIQSGNSTDGIAATLVSKTRLGDPAFVQECLNRSISELKTIDDPAIQWMIDLYPYFLALREKEKERDGKLNQLYGDLIEIQRSRESSNFLPDANGTLRFTVGKVEAYSPVDAILKTPITTVDGLVEKTTGVDPFITPGPVLEAIRENRFGSYAHTRLGKVPVAFLYSTDTTGGNSGSPVINAKGELVGVNFDRTFEATINDFAWDHRYSRSIGVDIRFVLWIIGEVYGAKNLTDEMVR
jgi:hypothetical protein